MTHRKLKLGYFTLEGLNAFATVYYFTYLFFYLEAQFQFRNWQNLSMAAGSGLVYCLSAWYGGRFGQRFGYFNALKLGFAIMGLAMIQGLMAQTGSGQVVTIILWTLGMCFTWPTLEALASEDENREGLTRMVGIYNVVWATSSGVASFVGGAMVELLGWPSVFWFPASLHLSQLVMTFWLERRYQIEHANYLARAALQPADPQPAHPSTGETRVENQLPTQGDESHGVSPKEAGCFRRMAWLANPFAYIAISTVIPLIPALAKRFEFTPMYAGFFCSVWLFARLGTFVLLWQWPGWHYRFGWLFSAFLGLILSFAALFLIPHLGVVILAQLFFGWAIGLIYYSSLFYSMDETETKGVHGGIHESVLGIGIFAGPALGAGALRLLPQQADASTWAVSALLLAGLGGLFWLRRNQQ